MRKKPLALRRLGRFYLSDLHGIRREHRLEDRFTFYVKRVQIFATGSRSLFARQQTSAHIRLRVVNRSFPYFLRGKTSPPRLPFPPSTTLPPDVFSGPVTALDGFSLSTPR